MKNRDNRNAGKLWHILMVLLATALFCIGWSIADHLSIRGVSAYGGLLPLLPEEEEQAPTAGKSMVSLLLPGKESSALPVTAEGDISDFLVPQKPPKDKAKQDDLDTIKTRTYEINGDVNILLYHTHTTEAYCQTDESRYKPSGDSRTKDNEQNIVKVGETLKTLLEGYGFGVIHDTTDHEPPKLATAYSRSVVTMEKYKKEYPEIDIFIDIHRDAANLKTMRDDVVVIEGKRCARLMCVVGTGEGTNGGYNPKPDFIANYTLAKSVCERLDTVNGKFTRDIRVKPGRYNQHISDMCLLVEVGHNANTLEEALNSLPYLAKAISEVVKKV